MPTLMGYDSDHAALARRGRPRGRRDRLARGHGDAVRGHPARRGVDVDDDQLAGGDPARVLRLRRRGAGRARASSCAGRSRPTSSRSTSRRRSTSSRRSRRCGSSRTWSSSARARCRSGIRSRSPATTSARPGSTAAQELAFTLADGFTYVEWAVERGLDVDDFAPRLSFFFNAHLDFFEEIAKYRAARRIWATRDARPLRREEPALVADALPHADGRRVADGAAAGGEHRAHGDRGARGGARRDAVAAHELATTRRSRCRPRTRCGSRCARSR